jgi:adenylate kinase family enzyme
MQKIIIINGKPESGKNTFSLFIEEISKPYNITVFDISTVDIIKQVAKILGWDGKTKEPRDRKFLSDLKDLSMEYNDGPCNYIKEMVKQTQEHINSFIIFVHCREPEEIGKLKEYYGDKCITILIKRLNHNVEVSNHADKLVENFKYDYILTNTGDERFKKEAKTFFENHL